MAGVPPPTSAVRHGHRRAYSDEPPSQPSAPIDAGCQGEAVGGDLTVGDLASDELWPVSAALCFCLSDGWVPVDRGPQLSVLWNGMVQMNMELLHRLWLLFYATK